MAEYELQATVRNGKGKSYRKKLMSSGRLPGVVYGKKVESLPIEINYRDLHDIINQAGRNAIINLKVDNAGEYQVMIKDMQFDFIKQWLIHVDFYQISMEDAIEVSVPIQVTGKVEAGILQMAAREMTVSCLPGKIPEAITVDVSNMNIGDSLTAGDLQVPEDVKVKDPDTVILSVIPEAAAEPQAEEEEVEGAEAGEEAPATAEGEGEEQAE